MKRLVMDIIGGLAIVGYGVLVFFDPKPLWWRWPFMSLTERNNPSDEVDRTFGRIIGVCLVLIGLAYTIGMVVEYLAV